MNNSRKRSMRYLVILGAVLIQFCVGAVYTWSLFNQPLVEKFGWERSDIMLAYSINIFTFAATTMFSGKLQDRFGPRLVASLGGIILGAGLFFTGKATTLDQIYLSYGLLAGIGVGMVYPCPLATCLKWFPERKGFITGIVVGAFGLGGVVFKGVIIHLLGHVGVSSAFTWLGYIYLLIILAGSQFLKVPNRSSFAISEQGNPLTEYSTSEMLQTTPFYLLWLTLFMGTVSGLLVIGMAKDIGVDIADMGNAAAANAVVVASVFNAAGRLFWGTISDTIGRIRALLIINAATAVSMLMMGFLELDAVAYMILLALIASSFGGLLAIYPVIAAEFFGVRNLGGNYGLIFIAYGLAAVLGPVFAKMAELNTLFLLAASLAILSMITILFIKKPRSMEPGGNRLMMNS